MKMIITNIPVCSVFSLNLRKPVRVKLWKIPISKTINSIEIHREIKDGSLVYFAYGFFNGENIVPSGYEYLEGRESITGNNLSPGDLFHALDKQLTKKQLLTIENFIPEFAKNYKEWSTFI